MTHAGETTIRNLYDPLTRERRDVSFAPVDPGASGDGDGDGLTGVSREIDGTDWWVLPSVVDGDAHMPFVPAGLRRYDLAAALHGGVQHMVVALPFQLARSEDLRELVADFSRSRLPVLTPVLSISPDAGSADFPSWLTENLDVVRELLPSVVKLYTGDPNFLQNLEAVRGAGLKPAVFAFTEHDFEEFLERAVAPLHVRHMTSAAMLDSVHAISGATCQTSPHMLLGLQPGRRDELSVMPTPPGDEDRSSLVEVLGQIDMIASDHVSPPVAAPTGPGLQTQQHFVPALLTLADQFSLDLGRLWRQVTIAPAEIFGLEVVPGSVVIDPVYEEVGLWPRQRDDRAPYLGTRLKGRVLAVTRGPEGVMV